MILDVQKEIEVISDGRNMHGICMELSSQQIHQQKTQRQLKLIGVIEEGNANLHTHSNGCFLSVHQILQGAPMQDNTSNFATNQNKKRDSDESRGVKGGI